MVNDKAVESTPLGENFCSQSEIMRNNDDLNNHPNAPDDAQIELKSHAPHIKLVNVNDANKFSVVIFVNGVIEKEERLLKYEKRLDSNSFENTVNKKVKLHAYLFSILIISRKNLENF